MSFSILLLLSCGLSVSYLVTNIILRRITASRFKSSHGCLDCSALPQRERIVGPALLKAGAAAVKAKDSLECAIRRIESTANTFSNTIVQLNIITIIDPANIQAILAQKFKDHNLGGRIYAWGPLVGKGVFTSDGAKWVHRQAMIRSNSTGSNSPAWICSRSIPDPF
jgi:hypothetical protein